MKAAKRILVIFSIACLLFTTLSACSRGTTLNGTYQKGGGLLAKTYSFDRKGNVTISTAGGVVESSGTYNIKGNLLTITKSSAVLGISVGEIPSEHTFKKQGSSIYIDGSEYLKVG